MGTKFSLENLKVRDHSKDTGVNWRNITNGSYGNRLRVWNVFVWFRTVKWWTIVKKAIKLRFA
jgi:hypothetical protein